MRSSLLLRLPLFLALFAGLFLASCKKKKPKQQSNTTSITEARTSASAHTVPLSFGTGSEQAVLFTLESSNSSAVTVTLSKDDAPVTAARLMPLPSASYTMSTLQYQVPANSSLPVPIVINKTNLTVDTTYGLYFKIEQVSAGSIATDARNILVKITLRNRWDGRYMVTGTMTDVTQSTYTFTDQEVYLVTTGPNQGRVIPKQLGIPGLIIKIGGSLSYYSNFGPVLNFANDNKVSSMVNHYGQPASNGRSAELDPSGANQWNPSNKSMALKFWMNEPAAATPHRSAFNTTWTYLGER